MTIVNPTGAIKKYVDEKVSAEETARKNADSSLQTAVNGKVPTSRKVNGHALTADVTVTKSDVGLGNTDNGAKAPSTDATLASTTNPPTAKVVKDYVDGKFAGDLGTAAYKDVGTAAGNVPVLGSDGKLAASTMPAIAISEYAGNYSSKTNLPTTGYQIGDWATVAAGQLPGENGAYMLTATSPSFVWTQIAKTPTDHTFGTLGGNPSDNAALQAELDKKQDVITTGRGLEFLADHKTLRIATTVGGGTIGGATVIPKLTYSDTGQITKAESVTVYPPTTAGTSGQVWQSDGSGAGAWVTPLAQQTIKSWSAAEDDALIRATTLAYSLRNNQIAIIVCNIASVSTSGSVTQGQGSGSSSSETYVSFACDASVQTMFSDPPSSSMQTAGLKVISVVRGATEDDEYKILSCGFKITSISNAAVGGVPKITVHYTAVKATTDLSIIIQSQIY